MKTKGLFRSPDGIDFTKTFVLVSSLFLLWGCCNGLIDVLNKHFQNSFHINKAQSAFVQFANYMAYFFMAMPASIIARRFGYKAGIIVGLGLVAMGAYGFIPATLISSYWAFLAAVFVLATGLTYLETVANPYTTLLGSPEKGPSRINLAHFSGGIGWMIGPLIGGHFILSSTGVVNRSNSTLYMPYLYIAIAVTVLAVIFLFSDVPDLHASDDYRSQRSPVRSSLWAHPHFTLSVVAQFCYVAAQTGIFSFFINYVVTDTPRVSPRLSGLLPAKWLYTQGGGIWITERGASQMLAFGGFGLLLVGRLVGPLLMRKLSAHSLVTWFGLAGTFSMILVMMPLGWISVMALFSSFFFMSLMFPTIFALGIHGLGELTKKASSFLVMSIVGGAIMPIVMGWLADKYSMRIGFGMPFGCFIVIMLYGAAWPSLKRSSGINRGSQTHTVGFLDRLV